MDDVIIARRDIEWAGPSIAVQACESLAQVDVLRARATSTRASPAASAAARGGGVRRSRRR